MCPASHVPCKPRTQQPACLLYSCGQAKLQATKLLHVRWVKGLMLCSARHSAAQLFSAAGAGQGRGS